MNRFRSTNNNRVATNIDNNLIIVRIILIEEMNIDEEHYLHFMKSKTYN